MTEQLMYHSNPQDWALRLKLLACVAVLTGLASFWIRRRIVRGVYCEVLRIPLLLLPLASLTATVGAFVFLIDGFIGRGYSSVALRLLHQLPWLLQSVEDAMAIMAYLLSPLALAVFIIHEVAVPLYRMRPRFRE
jgi:hypothetical protein